MRDGRRASRLALPFLPIRQVKCQSGILSELLQGLFVGYVVALSHPVPNLAALLDETRIALKQQVEHLVVQGENRKIALFLSLQNDRLGARLLQHGSQAAVCWANFLDRHPLALPDSV